MKTNKIYKFLTLSAMFIFALSCQDRDEIIYEGNQSDQALISFSSGAYNLEIDKNDVGSLDVIVFSSARRDSDRTYNIEIIEGEENTTADPSTYVLPSTVTIPANELKGTLTIEGIDNNVTVNPELLTIKLTGVDEASATYTTQAVISVYEVCPVPETFLVGEYQISDDQASVGPANESSNFGTGTVEISVGETPTQRVFTATVLPGIGGDEKVTLSLVCNQFVLQNVEPGIQCTDGVPYIFSKAADGGYSNSTYDLNDDNSIKVIYTEDTDGSCGGPFQSSFTLTKIQ